MTPTLPTASDDLHRHAEALYAALSDLVRVYQFRDRDRICCHDISVTQCYALEALMARGALTLNELAAALYLDKSTTSRVVAALERKGYVERRPHPEDGRAVQLSPTAAGAGLCTAIRDELVAEEAELLRDLEPGVRQGAVELIRRLARSAERRAGLGIEACAPAFGQGCAPACKSHE